MNLKTLGILLLLGGVVFGVTIIASYTGGFQPAQVDDATTDGGGAVSGPPLAFAYTEVSYDPNSTDEEWGTLKKLYPGFFEVSPELNYQSFWFKQPHRRPVRAAVKSRSCSACTSARIGTLPADPLADYVKQVKEGKVPPPFGPAEMLTASLLAAGVSVDKQVQWSELDFEHPERAVTLPAAAESKPVVGLVQMIYKVTVIGEKTLEATMAFEVENGPAAVMGLKVASLGMPAFRLIPGNGKLSVGELPEGAGPRTQEVICWSATRRLDGPGRTLPPPAFSVSPRDPFVELGTPVPVPAADLPKVAAALEVEKVQPPVLGAYRIPVTVHRTRPAAAPPTAPPEPDVGPFERQLAFTVPGEQGSQVVALTGTVLGLVSLPADRQIDLKSFPGPTGCPPKNFELVSDRPGLKLAVGECKPKYVTVKIGEPEDRSGRRYWALTVSVAPGVCQEVFPADSVVTLLADVGDGAPRRVKVPLKGQGFTRGGR